jgi:hypothetical protein
MNPLPFSQVAGSPIAVPTAKASFGYKKFKTVEIEMDKYLICCIKELHHCRYSSVEPRAFNFLCYLNTESIFLAQLSQISVLNS